MEYLTKKQKLGKVLIHERMRRGLSQQEVANAVDASLRNYQRWESGETFPHSYSLQKLQGFFGECINEVMIFDAQEHPSQDRVLAGDHEDPEADILREGQDLPSSEPFSETGQGTAETANNQPHIPLTTQRGIKLKSLLLCTILLILILVVIGFVIHMHLINPTHPTTIKPGGAWISPGGKTVGDEISFAAYAYPTHPGDPAIDHVNFTIYWQGVDPHQWIIACVARKPIRNDVFACTINLRILGAPAGKIKISFDVYDRQGNKNLAPNGVHLLIYFPTPLSPGTS